MTKSEPTLRSVDIDQDAEKLAAMWNASDDQWPGTFNQGVPMTAERVKREYLKEKAVDRLIWDAGDEIAGYCSLWEWPEEPNVTYIALLNVPPKFQKQSLARKFLTTYVERVIGMGSVRLDLHTWAGNLPAVPLYKKCGFFWMPDTSVHMLNFLPTILKMDATQDFFSKHDWYSSFKRELLQVEDEEEWEGMKVFTYRFEAGGETLTAWADRESRTITAIETDRFLAAAIAKEIAPPKGLPAPMVWRFQNKGSSPMQVSLIASGDEHHKIDYRTTLQVGPGEVIETEADVKVSVDTPRLRWGRPAPAIKSIVLIDGMVVELGTGLKSRPAIEIGTSPNAITLAPGIPSRVRLNLRSRVKEPVKAVVSLAPPEGLTADWTEKSFELGAEGYAGAEIDLRSATAGTYEVPVSIAVEHPKERIVQPPKPRSVFVSKPGEVMFAHLDDHIRVENAFLRIDLDKHGGGFGLSFPTGPGGSLSAGYFAGYPIPPMRPNEYDDADFEIDATAADGGVILTSNFNSKQNPGLSLRRRVFVTAGPVLRFDLELKNASTEDLTFQFYRYMWSNFGKRFIVPMGDRIVSGLSDEFPGPMSDEQKKADSFFEQWAATEADDHTVGMIWGGDLEEISRSGFNQQTRSYEIPAQSSVSCETAYIYAGRGGWRAVRSVWEQTRGIRSEPESRDPDAEETLSATFEPRVPIVIGSKLSATVHLHNELARKLEGTVAISGPGVDVSKEFETSWKAPSAIPVDATVDAPPGPQKYRVQVSSKDVDTSFDVVAVKIGENGDVKVGDSMVDGQRVLTIANGLTEIDVAPGFAATVNAFRVNGENQLFSAFPNARALGWMSPWHGGITPFLMIESDFPGKLWKEQFDAEDLEVADSAGVQWKGVRMSSTLNADDSKGLAVELDVLTVGASPALRYTVRVKNLMSSTRSFFGGFGAFLQPGGSNEKTNLISDQRVSKPSDRYVWGGGTGQWAAAINADTQRGLVMVSPGKDVSFMGLGKDGQHLSQFSRGEIPADGELSRTCYIAAVGSEEEARDYASLRFLAP